MGKPRVIAETGAGQHGVATATAAALFGLAVRVYMGTEDMRRQALNVYRMRLLGAEVVGVEAGARTLKDAINEALRDWVTNVADHALRARLGARPASVPDDGARLPVGDRPRGARADPPAARRPAGAGGRVRRRRLERRRALLARSCRPSRSRLVGVEAGGRGIGPGEHAARFSGGPPGVLHGTRTYVLQDERRAGRAARTRSRPGSTTRRSAPSTRTGTTPAASRYVRRQRRRGGRRVPPARARLEGIVPALETAHALAWVRDVAGRMRRDDALLVNLSGRGDKDVVEVARLEGVTL